MTRICPPHYPPFGSSLPNRAWNDGNRGYRFGFNGKEKDSETASDNFDFGARIYDGRLGRWLSVDPYYSSENCIYLSAYCFSVNSPIYIIDKDGKLWWVAIGAFIGGAGTALKLAVKGEFHWKDKRTWTKIGLGAATGAAIALCPASGLGAGGTLISSQLLASSILAGTITTTSSLIEQGLDKYFSGEDPFDLKKYNYGSAAFNGLISTLTFGIGATFGNQAALNSPEFLWRTFHDNVALYGVLAGSFLDVSRAVFEGTIEKNPDLFKLSKKSLSINNNEQENGKMDETLTTFPPIRVNYNRKTGKSTIDVTSLENAIDFWDKKNSENPPQKK